MQIRKTPDSTTRKNENNSRLEHDSMGEVSVPADRYWGAQTQRSMEHFPIGVGREAMPPEIIHAFGVIKRAAALVNRRLCADRMTAEKLAVIEQAAEEVALGRLDDHFPLTLEMMKLLAEEESAQKSRALITPIQWRTGQNGKMPVNSDGKGDGTAL